MGNKIRRQSQRPSSKSSESLSYSKCCYCQDALHEANDEDPKRGWRCRSCCRWIHENVNYWCRNPQCIYKETSGTLYMICSDCFNTVNVEDGEQKEKKIKDNETETAPFVVEKVKISLDKIR